MHTIRFIQASAGGRLVVWGLLTAVLLVGCAGRSGSLQARLDEKKAAFERSAPAKKVALYDRGVQDVAESGVALRAVNVGDTAPDFALPDPYGNRVRLKRLLLDGPVVVIWYRGGWCPYCNIQLGAMQEVLPKIRRRGATLVAISPETLTYAEKTRLDQQLDFHLLSDVGNRAARRYGLVYRLPIDVADSLNEAVPLARRNAGVSQELPLAATYVIDTDGMIRYAFVDADYRKRAEPADILRALDQLGP